MTITDTQKLAKHLMRLLKVNEVQFPVCRTPKGNFSLKFTDSTEVYEMVLDVGVLATDSIVEHENNIELKRMLDKYYFDSEQAAAARIPAVSLDKPAEPAKKKPGRPKKNPV